MMRAGAVLVALFASVLGGCAGFGGDTNVEPMAELTEFKPTVRITELWSAEAGRGRQYLTLSPWSDGRAVYVTDSQGQVSAFAADSGKRVWRVALEQPVSAGVGGNEKLLLLGTKKAQVIALSREDGKQLWSAPVSSEILAPPVESRGVVVVHTGDGKVFGFAAQDGKRLWLQERTEPSLSLRGTSTPAIAGDTVLSGFANGRLAAFGLRDGGQRWELAVAEPRGRNEIERLVDVDVSPLASGRVAYAAGYQGRMLAVSLESGGIVWSRELSAYSGMDEDRSNIYVSDAKGSVLAVDAGTGGGVWRQEKLHGRGLTAPAVFGAHVVVGDKEGYLHFLRREDGGFAARFRLDEEFPAAIQARPLVAGDTLYALDLDGRLVALRIR